MKLTFLWTAILASLVLIPVAQAEPAKCPSIDAIRANQFSVLKERDVWFAIQRDHAYDTEDHWDFVAGFVHADDEKDAETKLLDGMNGLEYSKGPIGGNSYWFCMYHNLDKKLGGIAITPPSDEQTLLRHLR